MVSWAAALALCGRGLLSFPKPCRTPTIHKPDVLACPCHPSTWEVKGREISSSRPPGLHETLSPKKHKLGAKHNSEVKITGCESQHPYDHLYLQSQEIQQPLLVSSGVCTDFRQNTHTHMHNFGAFVVFMTGFLFVVSDVLELAL